MDGAVKEGITTKFRDLFKSRSLYFKLLSYFASLLIPIMVIGLLTYIKSVNVIKENFCEKITSNVEAASDTIDIYLKIAQETSANFFNNDVVLQYLLPRDEQTEEIRTELWRIPKIIQRSENVVSGFADSIFVFIDNQDVFVSGGLNQFEAFFNRIYRYEKYDSQFWNSKLASSKYIELLPMSQVAEQNVNTKKHVVPIVMYNRINKYKAVMVLNIAIDSIEKTLKGNSVFNSTAFLVLDDQNQLIYDSDGFLGRIESLSHVRQDGISMKAPDEITIDGREYILSYVKSNLYGWQYYAITPTEELHGLIRGFMQVIGILCVVLIVMGILFSFLFSSNIYNPIKSIRDIIVQKKELWQLANSTAALGNEIETIHSGVRSLVDHQQKYKVKYDRYTAEYVDYSFLMLIKGHRINDSEILQETLTNEFDFHKMGYICVSVFIYLKEAFYEDILNTERMGIFSGIKKILWTIVSDYVPVYVMEYQQNIFVSIVNLDHPDERELVTEAFEHILSLFHNDEKYCEITVGTGSWFTDINDLGNSFNEAMTAISKRNREKSLQIIHSNDLSITDKFFYSFYDEQKLLNCIKAGDTAGVNAVIDSILDRNVQKGVSYEHMRLLMKELYSVGVRLMEERGIDVTDLKLEAENASAPGKNWLDSFVSVEELLQNIKRFFHISIELLGTQSNSRQGNLVSMIIKYIEENYMHDLCLELIADHMGVSAKYISRVFRENTGVLLTDFINEIRINKAKELLKETDLKIQDIAAQIGIENRTTFLRVFKKVEGISPSVYRNMAGEH
jgi:two-component system response regulator YesN